MASWFTKYLMPKISCDAAMLGVVTKEDVIRYAQHLDLIYFKSGTLYDIIHQVPCQSNETPRSAPGPHVDGVIGFVSSSLVNQVVG